MLSPAAAERPITLRAPEVCAIIGGRKSQTRLVLKPQPPEIVTGAGRYGSSDHPGYWRDEWSWLSGDQTDIDAVCFEGDFKTGYCEGDQLWVRETWASINDNLHLAEDIIYRADGNDGWKHGWRSPIHMPRWASRITLRVTEVRVQRLQDISEEDAAAEGIEPKLIDKTGHATESGYEWRYGFALTWNSLHKPGARWDDNPWVAAISFERLP